MTSRRDFLRQSALSAMGLWLPMDWPALAGNATNAPLSTEILGWISIDRSGMITVSANRSEMGQGTYQTFAQIVAEELEVSLDQVRVAFVPANPAKYGPQPSDGSFSVRGWHKVLLETGSRARQMLIQAAANKWNITAEDCYAENGKVFSISGGRQAGYGELAELASQLQVPNEVVLKKRSEYKLIGKPVARQDIPLKTNGSAIFGLDKKLPGMKYAVVERSPRFRGKVKSIDDTACRAFPGITHIFKVERIVFESVFEGVAIVAESIWAAMQARKLLKVEWDDSGFEHTESAAIGQKMLDDLRKPPPSPAFEKAFNNIEKTIEAVYETPYQAHACMETLNCIADVRDGHIEIWGPIQETNWIQADLSQRMSIPAANISVNMTFLGGGFGRKAFTDYPHEAALISKHIKSPVQVMWTREDDMSLGPFRPGAAYLCRGGVGAENQIAAFQVVTASHWLFQKWSPGPYPQPDPASYKNGSIGGLPDIFLKSIPHTSFASISSVTAAPVMWWRAPGANTNAFATESFIDELAVLAEKDPLDLRREHLKDNRFQDFIRNMEEVSNWNQRRRGSGWGVALTQCFGGICGHVVKVSRNENRIKIEKVIALIDCGWYVNPDTIKAQVEGSIIMALGAAVLHETTFRDGKAEHRNFDTYLMPRIGDIPEIEVHIAENHEPAGGVGEPGLPPFAPALCNAIFDLTGKRVRKLPVRLNV